MGIDTPSDEFTLLIQLNLVHLCQLGTNSSLDFPGQNKAQIYSQRNKLSRNGLVPSSYQDIYKLLGQEGKILYRNIMLRPFKSLSLLGNYVKLILYLIYMEINKTILHHPMKMTNFNIAKNSILIKI